MFTWSQNWFNTKIEYEIKNYMTMLSGTCTDTLFITLNVEIEFAKIRSWYAIRLVVANFISAQLYFLNILMHTPIFYTS